MDWECFLRTLATEKKLSKTEERDLLIMFPKQNYVLPKEEGKQKLDLSKSALEGNLGKLYLAFGIPGHKDKLYPLKDYLNDEYKRRNLPTQEANSTLTDSEFDALIESRTQQFVGREYVYQAFETFKQNHDRGYFTVVSEPGTGKTAIAANYVKSENPYTPHYFNIESEGNNTPEQFLNSIRRQLINRYSLKDAQAQDANLTTLLNLIARTLGEGESLVIVIDALDEVKQEPGPQNILNLPRYLPERIYFFLTRTHYIDIQRCLLTDKNTYYDEVDLRDMKEYSRHDIAKYLDLLLYHDDETSSKLEQWLKNNEYTKEYTKEAFKQSVLEKIDDNFMYASCLMYSILNQEEYQQFNLDDLPSKLIEYYDWHWRRMGMDNPENSLKKYILYLIKEVKEQSGDIYDEAIADILNIETETVQRITLHEWYKYFRLKGDNNGPYYYTFYHNKFFEYLKNREELDSEKRIFKELNNKIKNYLSDFKKEYGL